MTVRKTQRTKRGVRLVALATVAAYGALGRMDALAQQSAGDAKSSPATAQLPVYRFRIDAGPLDEALDAFHAQSGVKLDLEVPLERLATLKSAGVAGLYSNEVALKQLLKGTGFSYTFEGPGVVSIGLRSSESVDVTTSVATLSMQQFTEPLLDTAQTVTSVPTFVLQDEAATTLRDGLRNVPGISMAAGEGGSQGDTLTIRGFNARNDIFLDGIRDFGSYYRDAFDYQSIDVLEGPAGVEFGRGSTGGVVNQESKQPELTEFVHGTAQFGTNLMRRVTADVNEPLQNLGEGAAFRVNVVGTQSKVAERDITEVRRFGIAPALEFGLNTPTRYMIQYLHESENTTPDYGFPYFGAAIIPGVNRRTYYGFAADNYLRTNPDVVTGKVEHDLNSHIVVRNILRWANYPRDVRITEPQINTTAVLKNPTAVGGVGTATCDPTIPNSPTATGATIACYPTTTPVTSLQVKRNQLTSQSTEDMLWDQVSLQGTLKVLGITNDGLIIIEGGRERSDPLRNSYTMPYVSAVNPNPYDPFQPVFSYPGVRTYVSSQSYGIGFNDTLHLRDWLLVSGGVRFDYFNTNSHNAANPAALPTPTAAAVANRLDKQPDYRASVVVKPKPEGSVYFDWGTSFDPSAESLSLSGNNATAAPEENETYEVGAKWDFFRDRLNLNGSVFRTEKDNAHETDPNNSNNTITVGTYLIRGAQIGALGHLPQHFDLVVGYAFLNSELENSVLNASPFNAINMALIALNDPRANTAPYFIKPNGYPIANVPKNSGNLFLTHALWKGFVGGFGTNYTAARRASSGALIGVYNQVGPVDVATVPLVAKAIPGYWIYSAMIRRPVTEKIDFQVNINNLANKFYIDEPHPNHLVPGEGLNAQFGFNYKW
ncbi:TonB-dependent receptor plug domain-containing protein [Granulicella sp. 5B5]|uniref:TonB-dependent siderophore receptor n=1 Tax=Granulicella sp. 5B5 TaxID=1617967 RepID=UPI0015F393C7|nr:TonB-dependent siderophore receptor [Granulicella sp. 5B5]QMV18517.1 TonB-dependent receptor plug domain-containing protein [Granulicella sp. 5B5]